MKLYFASKKYDDYFLFEKDDEHHILNVLKLKNNTLIHLNYNNQTFLCALEIKNGLRAIIKEVLNVNNELKTKITLLYSLVKKDKFEFVVQKATELGVSCIVPYKASRSVVIYDEKKAKEKVQRWNKIALEACKQSKRTNPLTVLKISDKDGLLNYKSELNLIAYEEEISSTNKLFLLLDKPYKSITVLIGPEGGFTNEEVAFFVENEFISVSLGKRILRTETAPLYLLSVISFMLEREINNE